MEKVEKFVRSKLPADFVDNHIKHVVKEALWLSKFYPEADKEIVKLGAWMHDVTHISSGYVGDDHNVASAKTAREFLSSIGYDKDKLERVVHCIEAHRTSRPPEPRTIEARIVASADNLAHFTGFDFMLNGMSLDKAIAKLKRDLEAEFMLPEAIDKAKKIASKIEHKYNVNIL
jgi:hypothetical protein